ncbi:MAG: hypothetical protein HY903_23400 [Deltaproteobacteria bacterium]|nr:hypothetical protein [Deltaproteobacteria bacterium]
MDAPNQTVAELHERSFATVVAELIRTHATGAVEVHDMIGTNRAFFRSGVPQGAKLSRLKNPIGRLLVEDGTLTEAQLDQALEIHSKTDKLLGQVLLDQRLVDAETLKRTMEAQSRLNFLALFALREGQVEFLDGLVHLTDFTPAPMPPLVALYTGVRDHAGDEVTWPLLATLAFAAVTVSPLAKALTAELPAVEQMVVRLLETQRFTGDLARSVPLPPKALGALLYALHELGGLLVGPAINVPRA